MFWDNFKRLCDEAGKSPTAVVSELGFSSGVMTRWKNGTPPRASTLRKIADYFEVSITDLVSNSEVIIEKNEKPVTENGNGLTEQDMQLVDMLKKLTPEQKKYLLIQVQVMAMQNL